MNILYKAIVGSKAFGLANSQSDTDYFTIVVPPAECIVGLSDMKGSQKVDKESGIDSRIITLKEFLKGVLQGKSNEIECLFVSPEYILNQSLDGHYLYRHRNKLLSKRMYKSLLGFTIAQQARMLRGNTNRFDKNLGYDPKCAAYGLRAIYQAIILKQSGKFEVVLPGWRNDVIRDIKQSNTLWNKDEMIALFDKYIKIFDEIEDNSGLPAEPDYDFWNKFLMDTYRSAINIKLCHI